LTLANDCIFVPRWRRWGGKTHLAFVMVLKEVHLNDLNGLLDAAKSCNQVKAKVVP